MISGPDPEQMALGMGQFYIQLNVSLCVKYPPRLNIKKGDGIADLLMVSTYNLTETGDKGITMVSLSERHSLRGHRNNT